MTREDQTPGARADDVQTPDARADDIQTTDARAPVRYASAFCELSIERPAWDVVVLTICGHDVGEFGTAPMAQLKACLPERHLAELYIDARSTQGASIEVSSGWAVWLKSHRERFRHISMLTGSRFIQITAGFVRRFSGLEGIMRVYTGAVAFDEALAASIADAPRRAAASLR